MSDIKIILFIIFSFFAQESDSKMNGAGDTPRVKAKQFKHHRCTTSSVLCFKKSLAKIWFAHYSFLDDSYLTQIDTNKTKINVIHQISTGVIFKLIQGVLLCCRHRNQVISPETCLMLAEIEPILLPLGVHPMKSGHADRDQIPLQLR